MTPQRITPWIAAVCALTLYACASSAPGGIHARLGYTEENGLRVIEVPPGGPAAKVGLRVNDRVIAIDGEPVRNLDYAEIVKRLRGRPGSVVELKVVREGKVYILNVPRQQYRPR